MAADCCHNPPLIHPTSNNVFSRLSSSLFGYSFYTSCFSHALLCFSLILLHVFAVGRMSAPKFEGGMLFTTQTYHRFIPQHSVLLHLLFLEISIICIHLSFFDCRPEGFTELYLQYLKGLFPEWHRFLRAHHCIGTVTCFSLCTLFSIY